MTGPDLLDRVQPALHPRYEIERELGRGPTGAVFAARDLSLRRRVVIKVLYPGVSSEPTSRRFIREARILASLSHPSIVAIHEIGEKDGLHYYVRDYLDGESLSDRLARGPLSRSEVVHLCRDLLAALGAAHRLGVIHRDLRPMNVFCLGDRFVLADFGIAGPLSAGAGTDSEAAKTPQRSEYAAPEQLTGGEVGTPSDLYVLGMLVYQAFTGRVWISGAPVAAGQWSRVPRRLRPVLRRALAPAATERWGSAAEFRDAVDEAEAQTRTGRAWAYAGYALVLGGLVAAAFKEWGATGAPPRPLPRELAILPLESGGSAADDSLGTGLAHLLQLNLDNLPGLSLTPARQVKSWWDGHHGSLIGVEKGTAARDLRVRWVVHGVLDRQADSMRVRLTVYDAAGRKTPIPEVRAGTGDLGAVGDTLAVSLVRAIAPHLASSYRVVGDVGGKSFGAQREFLRGEAAFQQDAWALAERYFESALQLDSTFALAAWRLANVRRWRRLPHDDDLSRLYDRQDARLPPLDRGLIEALRETSLRTRLAKLDSVIARFPDDAYARLLIAEELFHRGPLVGRGLVQGTRAMADAVARDSSLALAYDHLVFGAIRLGHGAEAGTMLADRRRVGTSHSPGDPDVVAFAQLAYDERFVPWRARLKRRLLRWTADSAQLEGVSRVFRTGISVFDIPESQVALSDLLLRAKGADSSARAGAYRGKGMALLALGRPSVALPLLDSATEYRDSDTARVEQAEWRVLLPALGLPVPSGPEWPARLVALAADSALGARAAWALGFSAYAGGDTLYGRQWRERLRGGPGRDENLDRFLGAMALAARQQWRAAFAASDSIEDALNATTPPDPFVRAAFHLQRGKWLTTAGDHLGADREWLWYEASDVEGWPQGLAQAGEIDGVLSVYARLLRARLLLRASASPAERAAGCVHLRRAVELWAGAEETYLPLRDEAASHLRECPA